MSILVRLISGLQQRKTRKGQKVKQLGQTRVFALHRGRSQLDDGLLYTVVSNSQNLRILIEEI